MALQKNQGNQAARKMVKEIRKSIKGGVYRPKEVMEQEKHFYRQAKNAAIDSIKLRNANKAKNG